MPEIDFNDLINDLPLGFAKAIGLRYALRIIPNLRIIANRQDALVLSIFRALYFSYASLSYPTPDIRNAAARAAEHVRMMRTQANQLTTSLASSDTSSTVYDICSSVNDIAIAISLDDQHSQDAVINTVTRSLLFSYRSIKNEEFRQRLFDAFTFDLEIVKEFASDELRKSTSNIISLPLWINDIPDFFRTECNYLIAELRENKFRGLVWIEWYEQRLSGSTINFNKLLLIQDYHFSENLSNENSSFWHRATSQVNTDIFNRLKNERNSKFISIGNASQLESWLKQKPFQWSQAVISRISLRMMPFILQFVLNEKADPDQALVIFRAAFQMWAENTFFRDIQPSQGAFHAAGNLTKNAAEQGLLNILNEPGLAASASFYQAVQAATSYIRTSQQQSVHVADAASFAEEALKDNGDESARSLFWQAVSYDISILNENTDQSLTVALHYVMTSDLWAHTSSKEGANYPRNNKGKPSYATQNPPSLATAAWSSSQSLLLQAGDHWQVWIDWYNELIEVFRRFSSIENEKGKNFVLSICAEEQSFWNQNPAIVNVEMARRLDNFEKSAPLNKNVEVEITTTRILPELPYQGHGPHYRLAEGEIVFAPQGTLDGSLNDISRLQSLHPVLRMLCKQAVKVFGGNIQHSDVAETISEYSKVLNTRVEEIDFAQLAGYGLIIAHIEGAANREIGDRLRSEFEDNEKAILKSLLDAHGPFILATQVGRDLLLDAELYQRNSEQERIYNLDGAALVEAAQIDGIVRQEEAKFTRALAEDVGKGPTPERTAIYGQSAIRNFTIAVIGGGAIGACAVMGKELWDAGQPFLGLLGGGIGLSGVEALKKSKPFQDTIRSLTSLLDKIGGFDENEATKYKQFATLILKEEDRLRRLAGTQREYQWLHEWLDWIKASYKL